MICLGDLDILKKMGRKKRILVADDSITIQKLVNVTFAGDHFEVILAMDGHDTLVKIQRLRPDVVLLDSDLRDLSLNEIEKEMKREGSPYLIWLSETRSNRQPPSYVQKALTKPFDAKALSSAVYDLLEGEESTVIGPAKVSSTSDMDEEVTEKTEIMQSNGPFSSYRMLASQDESFAEPEIENSPSPFGKEKDLSSRLENIAKEVVSVPPASKGYDEDEDTVKVKPQDFRQPVNLEKPKIVEPLSEAPSSTPAVEPTQGLSSDEFESLAKDMIRQWMDENLPRLAEDLIKQEISKIAGSR